MSIPNVSSFLSVGWSYFHAHFLFEANARKEQSTPATLAFQDAVAIVGGTRLFGDFGPSWRRVVGGWPKVPDDFDDSI